jgi:hypothetical protein
LEPLARYLFRQIVKVQEEFLPNFFIFIFLYTERLTNSLVSALILSGLANTTRDGAVSP